MLLKSKGTKLRFEISVFLLCICVYIYAYKPSQSQNHPHLTVPVWNLRWNKALAMSSPKYFHHYREMGDKGHVPPLLTLRSQLLVSGPLSTLCHFQHEWKDQHREGAVGTHKGEHFWECWRGVLSTPHPFSHILPGHLFLSSSSSLKMPGNTETALQQKKNLCQCLQHHYKILSSKALCSRSS